MSQLYTSKFIRLLKTFSQEEIKSFVLWLKSPWANSNKNLVRLMEHLRKYHPSYEFGRLDKKRLFHKVIPHGTYSARSMNNLLSEAFLSAERFLVFEKVAKTQELQDQLLSDELQRRKLQEWFLKKVERTRTAIEGKPVKDWEDYLNLYRLSRLVYHQTGKNVSSDFIDRMDHYLDGLYAIEKGALITDKTYRKRIVKNEEFPIEQEIRKWELVSQKLNLPTVRLYRQHFSFPESDYLEEYFAFRGQLLASFDQLSLVDQIIHLQSFLNDTAILIRSGKLDITDMLPGYRLGIESGILLDQGVLPHNSYATVVSASNTANDFAYSYQFIEEYTEKLDESFQADARHWAKGHTAYWQEDHDTCLNIMLSHNFKTLYFNLLARILTTQVYMDLFLKDRSYADFLFNYFDSFEKWIQREKHRAKFSKRAFLRFIQVSRSLAKFVIKPDADLLEVSQILTNEKNIQAYSWLKEKQQEVIRRKNEITP